MTYVVDTHILLWFLQKDARLSADCKAILLAPESELILPATALADAGEAVVPLTRDENITRSGLVSVIR